MKVLGYEERSGNFADDSGRNIVYDNFLLHLVGEFAEGKNGKGQETTILKIKRDLFQRITGYQTPAELLGQHIELGYSLSGGKPVLCSISLV